MLRRLLVLLVFLATSTSALAQDLCVATIQLQRIFITLQNIADERTPASVAQVNELNNLQARYSPASVEWTFRNTNGVVEADLVQEAFSVSVAILEDLRPDTPIPLRLAADRTKTTLSRGLSELARLDCPPAIGIAREQSDQTGTARQASALGQGQTVFYALSSRDISYMIGFAIVLASAIVAYIVIEIRQKSVSKRYVCNMAVNYKTTGKPPRTVTATVVDISRGGLKIKADQADIPTKGSKITLQFQGETETIRIQWCNVHFFGGQFSAPYSYLALRKLLGPPLALSRNPKKPKVRAPMEKDDIIEDVALPKFEAKRIKPLL